MKKVFKYFQYSIQKVNFYFYLKILFKNEVLLHI